MSVWRGVGIARDAALKPAVPHSVTSPLRGFGLTNGNGLAATTVDVRWGDPRLPLVSGGREVVERVPESPLGLSLSLIGRDYVEDGGAGRRLGRGRPRLRLPGEPREAERCRRRAEGGRGPSDCRRRRARAEQFARYRGGVQRLHTFGPTVQEGGPRSIPWWRRRERRRRSEGYHGASVGARGTLERRGGAPRGGGASGAPRQALGAGAADRVRYGCKVDRSREEFGSGEILASHEDHVGGGNEGRAEHLELAERGGPGGARGAQATVVKLSKHQMRRTAA